MQRKKIQSWEHDHKFYLRNKAGEKRSIQVLILTIIAMVGEIIAGKIFGSMALLADGWHLGTHAAALGITIFAYRYARKNESNPKFSFGTGKVTVLGGFASGTGLIAISSVIALESLIRLMSPGEIDYNPAIIAALLGLVINLVSALLIISANSKNRDKNIKNNDHTLKAAYFNILTDGAVSAIAIVSLIMGKYFGLTRLDPFAGIIGAIIIFRWSFLLIRDTSIILLDNEIEFTKKEKIVKKISGAIRGSISDIHIWKVGPMDYAAIISIVTDRPLHPEDYKGLLAEFSELSHITIEVNTCLDPPCKVSRIKRLRAG